MTDATCQKPENLKGSPGECSDEQIRKCHGEEKGHACLGDEEKQILAEIKEMMGVVPGPMQAMSHRKGTLGKFMPYAMGLMQAGPLSAREAHLVALGTAAALKAPKCINRHSEMARENGASKDEVLQAILIAGLIGNTSMLHVSYESCGVFQQ